MYSIFLTINPDHDLREEHLFVGALGALGRKSEEALERLNGQQHELVEVEARQFFVVGIGDLRAHGLKACDRALERSSHLASAVAPDERVALV